MVVRCRRGRGREEGGCQLRREAWSVCGMVPAAVVVVMARAMAVLE